MVYPARFNSPQKLAVVAAAVFVIFGFTSLYCLPLSAQSNPLMDFDPEAITESEQERFLPESLLPQIIEATGLAADDLRVRSLFDKRARDRFKSQQEKAPAKPILDKSKLIAHFKNEKGGQPIISEEAVLAKLQERQQRNDEIKRQQEEFYQKRVKQTEVKLPDYTKLKYLPTCDSARTQSTKSGQGTSTATTVDVLFIPPNYKTSSAKDIFGAATEVWVYDPNSPDAQVAALSTIVEVPCLPYRKRHTQSFLFEHFGEHALRNYDGNPHGAGENLLQ